MAEPKYPSDQAVKMLFRFPDGLREKLKDSATRNRRSMNSEAVTILERVLAEPSETKKADALAS